MTEESGKTLTQLANELGVSRDKIIYRYKKLPEDHYFKENNTIYIKQIGVERITEELGDDIGELSLAQEETTPTINDYLIEQLTKKDEQIEQLQKLIDQQQQLNAEDKKLIKELHQYFAIDAPKELPEKTTEKATETTSESDRLNYDEQLAKLEEQIGKADKLSAEKEQLEQKLAALKQKKWFQFWKKKN